MANDAVSKDHRVAYQAWAREVGLNNASAEAIFDVVPPPLIYEWTNPRYTYSLVKGGPLYQRLGLPRGLHDPQRHHLPAGGAGRCHGHVADRRGAEGQEAALIGPELSRAL